jgi:hypothetical protein
MLRVRVIAVIGLILVLVGISTGVFGQSEATPTPAPSKTPVSEETSPPSESTPEPEVTSISDVSEPFTQTDLRVLTGNVQRPNGIQWFDNYLWTSCTGDWTVYRLEDESGETITYSYGVRMAHTMYVEDDGGINLWIPDYDLDALVLVSRQSSPVPVAENLPKPWGIAYLDESHFFITSLTENAIYKVSREGEFEVLLDGFRSPTGIVATEDYVYVVNNGSSRRSIEWLDRAKLEAKEAQEPQPLLSGVQNATNLVLANDGYLYFTYALGTRGLVGRVDPTACMEKGGCTNDEFQIVIYTELASPLAGLTISDDMTLYVHTIYRPEIYWVNISEFGG